MQNFLPLIAVTNGENRSKVNEGNISRKIGFQIPIVGKEGPQSQLKLDWIFRIKLTLQLPFWTLFGQTGGMLWKLAI